MERWKTDDPCALVDELAQSMPAGQWLNILVADLNSAIEFQTEVLGCETIYRDQAFAIMRFADTSWMIHADTTYATHPMGALLGEVKSRGAGCEIRIHGCDPDAAQERARENGFTVMAETKDKPHGLREAFLIDPDGYVWVPSVLKSQPEEEVAA